MSSPVMSAAKRSACTDTGFFPHFLHAPIFTSANVLVTIFGCSVPQCEHQMTSTFFALFVFRR